MAVHRAAIPAVTEVERHGDGVIITFEDGLCAIYPASLLYASKNLATIMSEKRCEEEHAQ